MRKAAGAVLLFITDVALAVGHAYDYPAYDFRSRFSRGVAEGFKIAAWILGWLAILATTVAYFVDLEVSGFADTMSPIVSIIWIPGVVYCLIGATISLAGTPTSGSGWDLGVIATQGAADILGVPGPGLTHVRAGVGFFGNAAAAVLLRVRSAAA